jgi:hypothetical protein
MASSHVSRLGQMLKGFQRLLIKNHRLAIRRPCGRLGPGLPAVAQGLLPNLALEGMVGEAFNLVDQPMGRERLDRLHNTPAEGTPSFPEQAAIGDLLGEGIREGVGRGAIPENLVEEFPRLEPGELLAQPLLGKAGHGLELREGDIPADCVTVSPTTSAIASSAPRSPTATGPVYTYAGGWPRHRRSIARDGPLLQPLLEP